MAVGFEKMEGGLSHKYEDREHPAERHFKRLEQLANGGKTLQPLKGYQLNPCGFSYLTLPL